MPDMSLASKLPDSDLNGLRTLRSDLVKHPEQTRVAVVVLDVAKITHNVVDGIQSPQLRVRAIEPLDDVAADEVHELMRRAYSQRTGKAELDLEWPES